MRNSGLDYQKYIDIFTVFIFSFGYSSILGDFFGIDTTDPIMGNPFFFFLGLTFFAFLALFLNIKKDYLDLYALIRLYIPSFFILTLVDLIDYLSIIIFDGIPFATVLTIIGVIVFLPVLTMMRLMFHVIIFMIFYYNVKYLVSLSRRTKYIDYVPTLLQMRMHKERN